MISLIIWFILLSSGSIYASSFYNKKYEEVLPITSAGIVLLLFLSGLIGQLQVGAIVIAIALFLLLISSVFWAIRKKQVKRLINNTLTPAFFAFAIIFMGTCYFNYARMVTTWDEFSHGADIVKVMVNINDFGTNPMSYSAFKSYPPGMALFQYFMQEVFIWTSNGIFNEWFLYVAYQIFGFSFIIPFLKKTKKPLNLFIVVGIVFLSLTVFFKTFYTSLYIDPMLGILSGVGLATIYLVEKRDLIYRLNIYVISAMSVLMKDAGMLFALILMLTFALDLLIADKDIVTVKKIKYISFSAIAVFIPKILWSMHLNITNAKINFSKPIEWNVLLDVILDRDQTYRTAVKDVFFEALVTRKVIFGDTNISINYFVLAFVMLVGVYLLFGIYEKKKSIKYAKSRLFLAMLSVQYVIYILGVCITYMFKFSEYEAKNLASFERYLNIEYFSIFVFGVILVIDFIVDNNKKKYSVGLVMICVMLILAPTIRLHKYVNRSSIGDSRYARSIYDSMCDEIERHTEESSKIYCIVQETTGYEFWVIHFSVRPRILNGSNWSVGESFYEGDIWTYEIDSKSFMDELCGEYDYVALYKLNDYFLEEFSDIFENSEDIQENRVYQVNEDTKLLELCE